jgi:hypothetical protein
MRSLTQNQAKILSAPAGYGVRVRVSVLDSTSTWRALDNLEGQDWIDSVEHGSNLDDPVSSATVTLHREIGNLSLAPFRTDSKINIRPGFGFDPLIHEGRRFKIFAAVVPLGMTPEVDAWIEVFDGLIDEVDAGAGEAVSFQGRDYSSARLQDTFIKTVRNYGSDAGTAVQTVMGQILADNGLSGFSISLPGGSPGWNITPYAQDRQTVLEALQNLAQMIGWEVRSRFVSGSWALCFQDPGRTKTTPDVTYSPDSYKEITTCKTALSEVRNSWEVVYTDSQILDTGGYPTQRTSLAQDTASIAAYGERYSQITEDSEKSPINTAAEALRLASAALADTRDVHLEQTVSAPYNFALELGDLVLLQGNGIHYTGDQAQAIVNLQHNLTEGTTEITVRGAPSLGATSWLRRESRPGLNLGANFAIPRSPFLSVVTDNPGALSVAISPHPYGPIAEAYELHVSTSAGFTPDATTLKAIAKSSKITVGGLDPSSTYYVSVVARSANGLQSSPTTPLPAIPPAIAASSIPSLDASKITSGQFGDSRLSSILADKVTITAARSFVNPDQIDTAGRIQTIQMGGVNVSTSNLFNRATNNLGDVADGGGFSRLATAAVTGGVPNQIYRAGVGNIGSASLFARGTDQIASADVAPLAITNSHIVSLAASKLTGVITNPEVLGSVPASALTGYVTGSQIAQNTIGSNNLAQGNIYPSTHIAPNNSPFGIINGNFESVDQSDYTKPAFWKFTYTGSTYAASFLLDSSDMPNGGQTLKFLSSAVFLAAESFETPILVNPTNGKMRVSLRMKSAATGSSVATVTVRFWYMNPDGYTFTEIGTGVAQGYTQTTMTTGWSTQTFEVTPPANASHASIKIDNGNYATFVFWINDVRIAEGAQSGSGSVTASGAAGSIQITTGTALSNDNANLFFDTANKRLGVGTNAPQAAADFRGSATSAGLYGATGKTAISIGANQNRIVDHLAGYMDFVVGNADQGLRIASESDISTGGVKDINFQLKPLTTSGWGMLEVWAGVGLSLGTGQAGMPVAFNIARAEKMRLSAGGRLLVGTTTDNGTNLVQVNGSIKSLSGGFVFPDGTTQTTASAGGGGSSSGGAGLLQFSNGSGAFSSNALFLWDNTNNRLGVGTAVPAEKLDVSGNIRCTGSLKFTDGTSLNTVADLQAIEALSGTSGLLKKTAANTWALDTTGYAPASHVGSGGTAHATATTFSAGFMSAADKSKLDGIASGTTGDGAFHYLSNGTAAAIYSYTYNLLAFASTGSSQYDLGGMVNNNSPFEVYVSNTGIYQIDASVGLYTSGNTAPEAYLAIYTWDGYYLTLYKRLQTKYGAGANAYDSLEGGGAFMLQAGTVYRFAVFQTGSYDWALNDTEDNTWISGFRVA